MRELHYGSDVVLVSVDICSAIFDYAVALANAGKTDRITVPVLDGDRRGYSNLLLGPSTQLHCTAAAEHPQPIDLDDTDLVATLTEKTQNLTAHPGIVTATPSTPAPDGFDDFDLA